MTKPYPSVHYHDYLQLDPLLSAQLPKSVEYGQPAHEETLFIIVHQVYELWFKQILHEVDSILTLFSAEKVSENDMGLVVARLSRVIEIQKLLIQQIGVMETMTPLDFLDFRDMLYPASGFQSHQFRMLENKLGLKREVRLTYNSAPYEKSLKPEQESSILDTEKQKSLFECVNSWLERTPFLDYEGFDFWNQYQDTVKKIFKEDSEVIERHEFLSDTDKERNLGVIKKSLESFEALFDEEKYKQAKQTGSWSLSYKAIHAALLIQLYRDQPALHLPFQLIQSLINIDEHLTTWRYRHALMAKRMLGSKIGTGGSSGYEYLRSATEKHRVFHDFFQLTTFFIPRHRLPKMPKEVEHKLGFQFTS
ncbi:MAG: tryptophan 2,3-dioxygenase [Bdellovibrionales bacterium]|nr:tryptophan 2,3-dioxygenase [Bdellovibrionales bacterium]